MTDLELQHRCVEAGAAYVKTMFPDLEDLEKKAHLQNACAAGYSKGWRDKDAADVLRDAVTALDMLMLMAMDEDNLWTHQRAEEVRTAIREYAKKSIADMEKKWGPT